MAVGGLLICFELAYQCIGCTQYTAGTTCCRARDPPRPGADRWRSRSLAIAPDVSSNGRSSRFVQQSTAMRPLSESTFGNQDALPSLPVPKLNDTCQKFLQTVREVTRCADGPIWFRN